MDLWTLDNYKIRNNKNPTYQTNKLAGRCNEEWLEKT